MAIQMSKRLDELNRSHSMAYSEKVDKSKYKYVEHAKPHRFVIEGDDATFRPKMW